MRFALIDQAKNAFPIQRLCKVLGVSQSGYFAYRGRSASNRQQSDMVMLAHVRSAFSLSNGTYGSPRMTRDLQDDGFAIGRRRTARLMRENGMQARQKRRFKRTTDSDDHWPVARNVIDQDFTATGPDEKWGVDISYIWTREGWLYLAVVIDLFARRVVGWATGNRLHRDLALAALRKALIIKCPAEGLIHHSDRGSQYCSIDYQAELRQHGIVTSMSGKGNCYDNAMVETLLPPFGRCLRPKTIKIEMIWRTRFNTRADAHNAIARYIDGFYNPIRRHSALDYLSPVQFEKRATN
jgi:putative transposase